MGIGDWGLGNWGLGIGPNPQSPIPNPQSPIPKIKTIKKNKYKFIILFKILLILFSEFKILNQKSSK